jgi:hypothetical protein
MFGCPALCGLPDDPRPVSGVFRQLFGQRCDARPTLRGILHFDNSNCSRLTIAVPDHFVNRFSFEPLDEVSTGRANALGGGQP